MHTHVTAFVGFDDGAELGLVVAAMFAILVLAALSLIVTFFGGLFRRIPWVGPWIADRFDSAARALRNASLGVWHGALWAIGHVIRGATALVRDLLHAGGRVMHALLRAAEHQAYVVIPREVKRTRRFAQHVAAIAYNSSVDYTRSVRTALNNRIDNERADRKAADSSLWDKTISTIRAVATNLGDRITQLRHDAWTWTQQAVARADRQFRQAEADAVDLFNQAEKDLNRKFDTAEADISQALRAAEAYARQQATQAETGAVADVNRAVHEVETQAWPEVTAMIGTLRKTVGDAFPAVSAMLAVVPAHVPTTAPEAVAAAESVLPPLLRLANDCVVPQCRDLGPTRNALHDMQLPVTAIALLAWFAEMVAAPQAWADQVDAVMGPPVSAATDGTANLLGM